MAQVWTRAISVMSSVLTIETLDGTKVIFQDESWLLLRQSGTEPVLRIYSEATSIAKVQLLLDHSWLTPVR